MPEAVIAPQAEFARALLDPGLPCPAHLKAWNGSNPTARLAVYRNNVVSGLIDALADSFPVTQALVGEEFFRAMASVFVRNHPPQSRILARYGDRLPAFIEVFEPARSVPYLADMARLEYARITAHHAADCDMVDPADVQAALAGPDRLGELRLVLHPSVMLLSSAFAMVTIWFAHQTDDEADLGNMDVELPEDAMVLRQALEVVVVRMPHAAVHFATMLDSKAGLGACANATLALYPEFDLSATLGTLFHHGAIATIALPSERHS